MKCYEFGLQKKKSEKLAFELGGFYLENSLRYSIKITNSGFIEKVKGKGSIWSSLDSNSQSKEFSVNQIWHSNHVNYPIE